MKINLTAFGAYASSTASTLRETLSCGQCFRFNRCRTANGKASRKQYIRLPRKAQRSRKRCRKRSEAQEWAKYFDLERNYSAILEKLSSDGQLCDAAKRGRGIRILAQEPWEALCSFIISQNNNIKRIMKIVASLCALFGDDLGDGHYSFPDAGQ